MTKRSEGTNWVNRQVRLWKSENIRGTRKRNYGRVFIRRNDGKITVARATGISGDSPQEVEESKGDEV